MQRFKNVSSNLLHQRSHTTVDCFFQSIFARTRKIASKDTCSYSTSSTEYVAPGKRSSQRDQTNQKKDECRHKLWKGLIDQQINRTSSIVHQNILEKQDRAIDDAMRSTLKLKRYAISKVFSIYNQYARKRNVDESNLYRPSLDIQCTLIKACVNNAKNTPNINNITSNGADVAVEALFRITQMFNTKIDSKLLETALEMTDDDLDAERRSKRALSCFRYFRSLQKPFSPTFVYKCFSYAVTALDLESAVELMKFARICQMFTRDTNDQTNPTELMYYNGVMYAALLSTKYEIVQAAHQEIRQRSIKSDQFTDNIVLSMQIDLDDETNIDNLLTRMQLSEITLLHFTYASLIRLAGRLNDTSTILNTYQKFEYSFQSENKTLQKTLSIASDISKASDLTPSLTATALGRADPTVALFQALRMCSAAEHAVERLQYLQRKYDFMPPPNIRWIIFETCFKGGRLDLAQQLRSSMENVSTRSG